MQDTINYLPKINQQKSSGKISPLNRKDKKMVEVQGKFKI